MRSGLQASSSISRLFSCLWPHSHRWLKAGGEALPPPHTHTPASLCVIPTAISTTSLAGEDPFTTAAREPGRMSHLRPGAQPASQDVCWDSCSFSSQVSLSPPPGHGMQPAGVSPRNRTDHHTPASCPRSYALQRNFRLHSWSYFRLLAGLLQLPTEI